MQEQGASTVHHIHEYQAQPPTFKVKLEKGQKNTYAWEIAVEGATVDSILATLREIDARLRQEYGNGQ